MVCLAGYVATQGQWSRLKTKWSRVLHKSGLDGPFHMTDFMSGKAKPYRDWSGSKRGAVLAALVDAITSTMTVPTVSILRRDNYAKLAAEAGRAHPNTEYMLCAIGCIARVAHALKLGTTVQSVSYFFESGDRGGGRFVTAINSLLDRTDYGERYRVASVQSADKRHAVGLQVADVLAHVVTTSVRKDQRPSAELSPIIDVLHPALVTYLDLDYMKEISRALDAQQADRDEFERRLRAKPQRKRSRS